MRDFNSCEDRLAIDGPALSFTGVSKAFGDGHQALADVSFDVAPGEFCVVLGASGSGKTTLLRMVNGLVDVSGGEIAVTGERLSTANMARVRRKIAMIHQQFNLIERLSVAQNVMAGTLAQQTVWRAMIKLYPRSVQNKALELIKRVGLGADHVNRRAARLSGGQQQRVAIARALMCDPAVILADEPVASLDPKIAHDVLGLIREAARERGAAVLCSLHQPDLARQYGDRIVALHQGVVVFNGPPSALSGDVLHQIYHMSAPAA
ncbi:phosphonate ABC transporter ATP-binding protein [Woodsholea maritima]|uniref:phosphonate ABC transporter ATP-binding protein n=1 Tax=Woodsholea maritima TaxID=240237 RepID=UPI0003744363|nr:phosphonate ABC transporter ATP-binding protein [Woodsholea maritima]